ncbi:nitroreductase family protein [Demequina sp. SYSU T00039]|uniref:Nitroreductase family protein n=1 Tax=Demequina lignilytica TaxID=3051663 RepID=A0AAW7M2D9_9MICO|nr:MULTISPECIES: nitroreductase family protein [unclassified Demequina]MDN4477875.1 nitroreductase family protein [Demequina sp. SYSU T00039-1]MDN4487784.1 nitroreductase family protein [Demequina sp. SYSU T00039]MDN4490833.1 nitroreductase family protein [Demequina sp. SYSU T00068]
MIGKLKSIAKTALANPAIRKTYNAANRGVLEVAASTRVGATAYSLLGFATHNREQWAVLSGRRAYYRNLTTHRANHVELRRNVHRLEKGILMQPRRAVFARDYIEETVEFYAHALERPHTVSNIDAGEMQWAYDVLSEYFSIVTDDDPGVARSRVRFESLPAYSSSADVRPYPQGTLARTDITFDQMLQLAESRRSIRWFQDKPVPRELVDQALLVARQSPSACNRLPYEFLVFDEPEQVKVVSGIPFGAAGYGHQIPTIVVVKGDLSNYFSPRDRHVPYIDSSLATMGFIYALETLGLSSSIINWPDFEPLEAKMAKTLGLAPHERVIMLIAVGYADPDALVAYSKKKEIDNIRTYNSLG